MSSVPSALTVARPMRPVLEISGLTLSVPKSGTVLVRNLDLVVASGEIHGLVGETGAGKSLTAWSVLGLLPPGVRRTGSIVLDGLDLASLEEREMQSVRGRDVAIVVQNPRSALVPTMSVGSQLALVHRARTGSSRRRSWEVAIEALADVRIGNPVHRARDYPHQLSGGQAQRVVIAMALLNCPKLVIADEATTGLDVTVQSEVLDLLIEKTRDANASLLLITHDLGVVANYTDTTTAMFAGEVIESGPTKSVFGRPAHPYMAGLLKAAELDVNPSGSLDSSVVGPPPNLTARPDGCQFAYRCAWRRETCAAPVLLRTINDLHQARCVRAEELETRKVG